MIDNTYISEAFKELNLLQEETFKLDDDGIDEMQDFVDNDDEEETLDIIDAEATTEEELEDSYVGKVIIDCSVCHSKLYKDTSEIVATEDSDLVNVGDECPYCTSVDGYTVIGQVAPYKPEDEITVTVEPKEDDDDTSELKIDADGDGDTDITVEVDDDSDVKIDTQDDKEDIEESFQSETNKFDVQKIDDPEEDDLHSTKPVVECDGEECESEVCNESKFDDMEADVDFEEKSDKDDVYRNVYIKTDSDTTSIDDVKSAHKTGNFVDYGAEEKSDKEIPFDERNVINKDAKYPKNPLTPEKIKEIGLFTAISDSVVPNGERIALRYKNSPEESQVYYPIHIADSNFSIDKDYNIIIKAYSEEEIDALDSLAEYLNVKLDYDTKGDVTYVKFNVPADMVYGTGSRKGRRKGSKNKPKEESFSQIESVERSTREDNEDDFDQYKGESETIVEETEEVESKECNEGLESLSLETETDRIYISAEEKETVDGEEMIAPLDAETQAAIDPNVDLASEPVEDEEEFDMDDTDEEEVEEYSDEVEEPDDEEPEEIDVDMDEFSEEDFDDVAESYFKRNYSNVESFKTSAVKSDDTHMIIEGIIKFNSGNQKKTTFIFESKDINRNGKMRFVGENAQISRGKKSFSITGRLNEKGSFITESFNYNYRAKDTNGKSNRVYGTVKNKR